MNGEHTPIFKSARPNLLRSHKVWVVERSFGWAARLRRLSRDYERLSTTLAGMHWLGFAGLMLSAIF